MTHSDLVRLGHRWLTSRGYTSFAEFATYSNESPDVIGWKGGLSILIECKASRGDFLSDGKKLARRCLYALGRRRIYLCPWGMIQESELPPRWGLAWARGDRVFLRLGPSAFPQYDLMGELRFMSSMLRRADIRLGDDHINDWLKWENRRTGAPD